jgi:predicted flap endonuclease-1-like 5' DNA nuclease
VSLACSATAAIFCSAESLSMTNPVCSVWWLLAAALAGWLLCGWFARQYLPRVVAGPGPADDEVQRLRAELAALRAMPQADVHPAARQGADPAGAGADDLKLIEGIGPKIAGILQAAGIRSFAQLAAMTPAAIQPLLDAAGPNYRIADPLTWPEQAGLAAAGRWDELKALQDTLIGGRRLDD